MGIPVLVLGASGSGKSTSIRNFKPDEVGIFNVASKPLPFRNKIANVVTGNDASKKGKSMYELINATLRKNSLKRYVIDDSQFLMAFEQIARAKEKGFDKYTDIGLNFVNLVQQAIYTSDDTIVYFLHHTASGDDGTTRAKTVGKLIDNWLTLEGMFSIVLLTGVTADKRHVFITQSDGQTTAKSPMDMFPGEMDNDLKLVDDMIREYYGMKGEKNGNNH